MASNLYKFDDPYSFQRPTQDGDLTVSYPFLANGDLSCVMIARSMLVRRSFYVPAVPGFTTDAENPGGDPAARVAIPDSPPTPVGISDLVRFTRTYSRIPATQTVYGSRIIVRPVMHDIKSGTNYAVSFDNGVTSHRFSSRVAVSAVGGLTAPTKSVSGTVSKTLAAITPDTWGAVGCIIRGTGSAAFFTSSDDAGIRTACQAGTGLTVSVIKTQTTITINVLTGTLVGFLCTDSSVDIVASGVGGTGASIVITRRQTSARTEGTETPSVTETYNVPTATRALSTGSAHSGSAGEWMAAWNGDKLVGIIKPIAASGSSITIAADESPWSVSGLAITHVAFAGQAAARYVNGPTSGPISCKEVTAFYLPGVTSGITTPADIPVIATKLDAISWLGELIAGTTFVAVDGTPLERWLGGPIYSQTTVSAQMSDAVETVSVSA